MSDTQQQGLDRLTLSPLKLSAAVTAVVSQVLSTRARKEVALADVKVQVCVFAFDCLYHNGTSLLHEPLTKRREVLRSGLVEVAGQLSHATTKISNDVEELEVRERWLYCSSAYGGVTKMVPTQLNGSNSDAAGPL